MTPDLLERIGSTLYGLGWKGQLATDLDVNDRTLRRWISGDMPIPSGVQSDIVEIALRRQKEMAAILSEVVRMELTRS